MKFTKENELVRTWVRVIKSKDFTKDDIPKISNLRDVVVSIIKNET